MRENSKIAYCGLYCPMCSFAATAETEDTRHLKAMPERYDMLKEQSLEECLCAGCKDQIDFCNCDMKPCAEKKGITSCADCESFPCPIIETFGNDGAPHHEEALRNLWRIKEVGYGRWQKEMDALTHCDVCGKRQSWYCRCSEHPPRSGHSRGELGLDFYPRNTI